MRICFYVLFWVIQAPFLVTAQNDFGTIGPKEGIHLHLNKTTFIQGERLWFKAYIQDEATKLPSFETTNLYVGIFDAGGEELKRKLYYVESGMARGDFSIDSTLVNTEYTIRAWTNFMRNFEGYKPFEQRIKIVKDTVDQDSAEINMQISVFPEGGQLIAGAYNNIGILLSNGLRQGVAADNLELIDETGRIIQGNIATNDFGMGKTGFVVDADKKYFLRRQGRRLPTIRQELPEASRGQLGMNIENNGKDKVLLTLIASQETFLEKDGDTHTIAFYQDDFIRFEDMEVNETATVLSIDRKELPHGILTVVLFDTELRPIAYRMFFNHRNTGRIGPNLEIDHCLTEFGDSLQIEMILPKGIKDEINLSLSVLPNQSESYDPDNSIVSSFLVRPYIKSYFQDHYFFQRQDRRKRYELDKRLLIEGWGKYDWDSRKLEEVRQKFTMETGIPFEGRVIDADLNEEQQVSLVAELSGEFNFGELQDDKSFKGNMVLFEGDSLKVSLIGKKGRLRKPKAELWFQDSDGPALNYLATKTLKRQLALLESPVAMEGPLNIGERIIALDEVIVTEKITAQKKFQISALVEGRLIDDDEIRKTPAVSSYILKLGFLIFGNGGELGIYVRKPPGFARVPVSIDGMLAQPGELIGMPLSSVRFFTFSKDRNGPFISMSLNPNYVPPNQRNKFVKFAITNGYARPQEYFSPNYPNDNQQIFQSFGALYWKADVAVNSEIPTTINVPIKGQGAMELFMEGMTMDGHLITQEQRLEVR